MEKIRLVIAEERTLYRQGVAALLRECADFEVVGEAANAEEVRLVCTRTQPDIVLMSRRLAFSYELPGLPDMLRVCCPDAALIILEDSAVKPGTEPEARQARHANGALLLRADIDCHELVRAVRTVVLPSSLVRPPASPPHSITEREKEVIVLIAQGLCNKEIAHRLSISTQTVKNHVSHLLEKLAFADRTQLAVYALEHHFDFSHPNEPTP
jgi:DNA-binding NarL/FixJ family response regulator